MIIDPRYGAKRPGQRQSHNIKPLLTALGVPVGESPLQFGDFAFVGNGPDGAINIGIELKRIDDLVTSMRTGRLEEQIVGMSGRYQRMYLVVEGITRRHPRSGLLEVLKGRRWYPLHGPRPVFWADVERFLVGVEEAGVRVRRSQSSAQTAQTIANVFYAYWMKDYSAHHTFKGIYKPQAPLELLQEDADVRRVRKVAMALETGIGWARSKAVQQQFGNVLRLATADVREWEQIDGIGKTIARDSWSAIRAKTTVSTTRASRVRQGHRVPARSTRPARLGQDDGVAAGATTERRLQRARTRC